MFRASMVICVAIWALACGGDNTPTSTTSQLPPVASPPPVADPRPGDLPPSPQPPQPVPPAVPRISRTRFLAFGDSITAGTTSPSVTRAMGAGLPESYPFKLLALLQARYTAQTFTMENE